MLEGFSTTRYPNLQTYAQIVSGMMKSIARVRAQSSRPHFELEPGSREATRIRYARIATPPTINVVKVPSASLLRRGAPSNVWRNAFAATKISDKFHDGYVQMTY
jgi:hypothetical protein